jgi:hypothetical protein
MINFIIFLLFIIGLYFGLKEYNKVIKASIKNQEDINIIIEELEFRLHRYELLIEEGDEEAKEKIDFIKSELKLARLLKENINN